MSNVLIGFALRDELFGCECANVSNVLIGFAPRDELFGYNGSRSLLNPKRVAPQEP